MHTITRSEPAAPAVGFPVERSVRRTRSDIDPAEWAKHADGCMVCCKHKRPRGVTRWLDGRTKPARAGWYERLFTDGVFRHYWNGRMWASLRNGQTHWHQVGDYPCWRGLTCTAFMSPSRYPVARAPNAAGNRLARQGQSELTGLLGPGSEAN